MNSRIIFLGVVFFSLSSLFLQESMQKGKASYYASKFEGRRTASGDIFRQDSLTAAHKTLPFGTRLKVTNLNNDSTVIVKVNDRLSKSSGNVIDLSLKAAKQLNFVRQGITTVTLEKIKQ
jgi:rare lipoprotein A